MGFFYFVECLNININKYVVCFCCFVYLLSKLKKNKIIFILKKKLF